MWPLTLPGVQYSILDLCRCERGASVAAAARGGNLFAAPAVSHLHSIVFEIDVQEHRAGAWRC